MYTQTFLNYNNNIIYFFFSKYYFIYEKTRLDNLYQLLYTRFFAPIYLCILQGKCYIYPFVSVPFNSFYQQICIYSDIFKVISLILFKAFISSALNYYNSFLYEDISFRYIQVRTLYLSIFLILFRLVTLSTISHPNKYVDIFYGYILGKTYYLSIFFIRFKASSSGAISLFFIVFYKKIYSFSFTKQI